MTLLFRKSSCIQEAAYQRRPWSNQQPRLGRCWRCTQRTGLRRLAVTPCSLILELPCKQWQQQAAALAAALYFALQPAAQASEASSAWCRPQPVAELAGFFDSGTEAEPSNPFTVFGTVRKKYLIEQRSGEKILGRTKGFTVEACAEGVAVAATSLQYPPNRPSPSASEEGRCQQVEGAELAPACISACHAACGKAVEQYAVVSRATTGFAVADDARVRAVRTCSRECAYECNKPGKFYEFQVTPRR